MTERPDEFAERDAVLNALRDLARAGLVHRHDPFAFATRAAVPNPPMGDEFTRGGKSLPT
jgi:hypothetical protein